MQIPVTRLMVELAVGKGLKECAMGNLPRLFSSCSGMRMRSLPQAVPRNWSPWSAVCSGMRSIRMPCWPKRQWKKSTGRISWAF